LRLNYTFTGGKNNRGIELHTVIDSQMTYVWTSQTNIGLKSRRLVDEPDQFRTQVKYDCKVWVPDSSVFDRPANIEFKFIEAEKGSG